VQPGVTARRALLLGLALWLGGCESWAAENHSDLATVEGCSAAVDHLRSCCPRYDSYLSCSYSVSARNANAKLDLTTSQSRCLARKDCAAIARAVLEGRSLCGVEFASRSCR
jgi:hypothetical protein